MNRDTVRSVAWLAACLCWSGYLLLDVTSLPRDDPSWRPTDLDYDKWSMVPGDGKITFGEQLLDVLGLLCGGLGLWSFIKALPMRSREGP